MTPVKCDGTLTIVEIRISFNITLLFIKNYWLTLTFNCFFASNQETICFNWPIILFNLILLQFFDSANERNLYEIKIEESTLTYIDLFCFSSFIFKKNHGFIQEGNPSEKFCYSWGRIRWYWCRWHWKLRLEDSSRFVFNDEKYENLIVVNDGGELTQNINQKKKFGVF